jgi:hypothetical protein
LSVIRHQSASKASADDGPFDHHAATVGASASLDISQWLYVAIYEHGCQAEVATGPQKWLHTIDGLIDRVGRQQRAATMESIDGTSEPTAIL